MPRIDDQYVNGFYGRSNFARQWFGHGSTPNVFYLVGANTGYVKRGDTIHAFGQSSAAENWSFIYQGAIENQVQEFFGAARIPLRDNVSRSTVNHEIVHQFGVFGGDGEDHPSEPSWDGRDLTNMTELIDDPFTGPVEGRDVLDGRYELGFTHLYKLRDFRDPNSGRTSI